MDGVDSPMLELAATIARTHHEKWDGTGYPNGLTGEQIPIEGRITCVADVYDALCSERPYKPKFPVKKCLEIMLSERGTRFDPIVLDAFLDQIGESNEFARNTTSSRSSTSSTAKTELAELTGAAPTLKQGLSPLADLSVSPVRGDSTGATPNRLLHKLAV